MEEVIKIGMSRSKLFNYLLSMLIIFGVIFGILYYFALSPDSLLYSIIPVTVNKNSAPSFKFAFYGDGDHKIQKPMAIAIKGDKVYITDAIANKIWVYGLNGNFKYSFGRSGQGNGELSFPYGIAVDNRDRVFVADMKNHRVQVFSAQGKFLSYLTNNGAKGTFNTPGGLAIVNNLVYITDIWKDKVYVFDLDGRKIHEFGSQGTGPGQFSYPNGITADNKGNIYVTDTSNNRVQVFNKKGKFVREFDGENIEGVQATYSSPRGITVLNDQFLYVVTSMSSQIWTSDLNGQLYYRFGEKGDGDNQLDYPNGIAIYKNRLYFADGENHGIKVFTY